MNKNSRKVLVLSREFFTFAEKESNMKKIFIYSLCIVVVLVLIAMTIISNNRMYRSCNPIKYEWSEYSADSDSVVCYKQLLICPNFGGHFTVPCSCYKDHIF